MGIWDWALEVYGRPGVAQACLTLQDAHGQNTSLLLWAVRSGTADPELLARAAEVARDWDAVALAPLREVRRALKPPRPPVADHARQALREDVKACELRAERVLLETLEGLSSGQAEAPDLAALQAASAAWGKPAPDDALAALAAALR